MKGANDMKSAATTTRSMIIMISPLVSKVKVIPLAHFAGYRDFRRGIGNACICKGIGGTSQTKKQRSGRRRRRKDGKKMNDDDRDGSMPFLG
jgi:hypothetical protein